VIARYNAAGQCLSLLLIFKDVNKKREFGDGSLCRVSRVQEREIVIYGHVFIHQAFHRTFPQTQNFKEGRSTFNATRYIEAARCCFRLLSKITLQSFVYQFTTLIHYSLWISDFFGLLKSCFIDEAAPWYRKTHLIGFAWTEVASVGVGVSAFWVNRYLSFNRNSVSEHLFSIPDTSYSAACLEIITPPNGLRTLYFSNLISKCLT